MWPAYWVAAFHAVAYQWDCKTESPTAYPAYVFAAIIAAAESGYIPKKNAKHRVEDPVIVAEEEKNHADQDERYKSDT